MNQQDRIHLLSELTFLRERLAELPDSAKIMRISTESRIRGIENRLAEEPVNEREPERVQLTFNGLPVIGSHGIFAEFGMKAVTAVAASLCTPLAAMGPIPNREQHQLLITNTALGSFGFELEEYRNGHACSSINATVPSGL